MHGSIALREDYSAGDLRKLARRENNGRVALRLTAIAAVLEDASRKDAASQRDTLCAIRQAQEGPPVQREGA
jgi:hypothetical protein